MKIVLLCGSKSSGKTTTATAIYAYHLTQRGSIPNASIDLNGRMSVVYDKENNSGIFFDIDSDDPEFKDWKLKQTGKYVNHTSFAEELKLTASNLFGLNYQKLIGTNDEKNEFCHIKWKDISKLLPKYKRRTEEFLTNREFLEVFGTDICRAIYQNCHIESAFKKLIKLSPEIGIIPDCRFTNEFEYFEKITDFEVHKIRLKRRVDDSTSDAENGLNEIDDSRYNLVVDNSDLSLVEKNKLITDYLIENNVLSPKNIEVK